MQEVILEALEAVTFRNNQQTSPTQFPQTLPANPDTLPRHAAHADLSHYLRRQLPPQHPVMATSGIT